MSRNRAERRKQDVAKAIRKRRIANEIYGPNSEQGFEYYNNLHQYSKNKIHCSCPICSSKTNRHHEKVYKISDLKKLESIVFSFKEMDEFI